jgi:hypothetical protein
MQPMMTLGNRGEVRWEWIGEAWKYFTQNPGTWIAMMAISFVITLIAIAAPILLFLVPAGLFASNTSSSGLGVLGMAGGVILGFGAMIIISLGLTAFLTAGITRAAIKQTRGETIAPGDLFSGKDSFLGVLGVLGIITLLDIVLIVMLAVVSSVSSELGALFSLFRVIFRIVAMGLLFYSIPLIVDTKAGVIDAIRTSISTTLSQWWMYVLFALVLVIIMGVGAIPCGLGLLVTVPMYFLATAAAYRQTFAGQDRPDFDHFATPPPPSFYQAQPPSTYPVAPEYPAAPPRPQFSTPAQQFPEPPKPQYAAPVQPELPPPPPPPTAIPTYAQETQLFEKECPGCGAVLQRAANFCNQCGHRIQPG